MKKRGALKKGEARREGGGGGSKKREGRRGEKRGERGEKGGGGREKRGGGSEEGGGSEKREGSEQSRECRWEQVEGSQSQRVFMDPVYVMGKGHCYLYNRWLLQIADGMQKHGAW